MGTGDEQLLAMDELLQPPILNGIYLVQRRADDGDGAPVRVDGAHVCCGIDACSEPRHDRDTGTDQLACKPTSTGAGRGRWGCGYR